MNDHSDKKSNNAEGQKDSSKNLAFQVAVVQAIIKASPYGILVVDENARIISINHLFFDLWGISSDNKFDSSGIKPIEDDDELLLKQVTQKVADPTTFVSRIKLLYENPAMDDHTEITLLDGRTLERNSTVLYDENKKYLGRVWFFRDVTDNKLATDNLTELANTDPLTGISNRRFFEKRAQEEFLHARSFDQRLSLLLFDIDKFKNINDHFGHLAGDEAIKSLCQKFTHKLRPIDLLGRLGGDEFAVLLPDTSPQCAMDVAERLRQNIENSSFKFDGQNIKVTITCGVASVVQGDNSISDVIKRADEALYQAKANGRNRSELI